MRTIVAGLICALCFCGSVRAQGLEDVAAIMFDANLAAGWSYDGDIKREPNKIIMRNGAYWSFDTRDFQYDRGSNEGIAIATAMGPPTCELHIRREIDFDSEDVKTKLAKFGYKPSQFDGNYTETIFYLRNVIVSEITKSVEFRSGAMLQSYLLRGTDNVICKINHRFELGERYNSPTTTCEKATGFYVANSNVERFEKALAFAFKQCPGAVRSGKF